MNFLRTVSAVLVAAAAAILAVVVYLFAFDVARMLVSHIITAVVLAAPRGGVSQFFQRLDPAFWVTLTLALGLAPVAARAFASHVWPAVQRRVIGPTSPTPKKPRP